MSFVCHAYVLVCHSYVIRMPFVCHSYVIVCHSYVSRIYIYVLVCMPSVCHSYVLVCHPYVTRMYSYVTPMYSCITRMSLVCTPMTPVCHWYVLICHPYVTGMYSYVTFMSLVCHSSVVKPHTSDIRVHTSDMRVTSHSHFSFQCINVNSSKCNNISVITGSVIRMHQCISNNNLYINVSNKESSNIDLKYHMKKKKG